MELEFKIIDTRLDNLLQIKRTRLLSDKEQLEFDDLQTSWNDIINKQELNPYEVTPNRLPYTV
jgi:hypothetical protein